MAASSNLLPRPSPRHPRQIRPLPALYCVTVSSLPFATHTEPAPAAPGFPRLRPARHDQSDVRAWARSEGIEVKDKGRVPAELVVKFQAAGQ